MFGLKTSQRRDGFNKAKFLAFSGFGLKKLSGFAGDFLETNRTKVGFYFCAPP